MECGVGVHRRRAGRQFGGREEAREGRASVGAESSEAQEKVRRASHSDANRAVCDDASLNDGWPIGPCKTASRTGTAVVEGPGAVSCLWRDGAHTRTLLEVGQWYFSGLEELVSFLRCT